MILLAKLVINVCFSKNRHSWYYLNMNSAIMDILFSFVNLMIPFDILRKFVDEMDIEWTLRARRDRLLYQLVHNDLNHGKENEKGEWKMNWWNEKLIFDEFWGQLHLYDK
jgi:hypothetical protein